MGSSRASSRVTGRGTLSSKFLSKRIPVEHIESPRWSKGCQFDLTIRQIYPVTDHRTRPTSEQEARGPVSAPLTSESIVKRVTSTLGGENEIEILSSSEVLKERPNLPTRARSCDRYAEWVWRNRLKIILRNYARTVDHVTDAARVNIDHLLRRVPKAAMATFRALKAVESIEAAAVYDRDGSIFAKYARTDVRNFRPPQILAKEIIDATRS